MSILKNKSKVSTIALVLLLTIALTLVVLPAANAQKTKKTYAYIGAIPNPVGVGQTVLLHVGITDYLAIASDGWKDLTVTVTRPNNTTETLGPIRTDSTGGTGVVYVPTMVGTYYLQTHFPAQWYNWTIPAFFDPTLVGPIWYEASDSEKLALIVQEEPIEYYPGVSLPTEYWTRPIDVQLREWSNISGSWLWGPGPYGGSWAPNAFAPYNDGPESAHILWVKPFTTGGLAGGELVKGMEIGDAYEGKWSGSLIIAGRLYYQSGAYNRPRVYHCVDLHTGEELWAKTFLDNRSIAFGQLFYWESYNYMGVFAYLWVVTGGYDFFTGIFLPETWYAFDAYTGDWMFTIKNVPSGTTLYGSKGEIYRLSVDLTAGWMALWNMSALCSWEGSWGGGFGVGAHLITHDAAANTTAAKRAWSWNKTIPKGLPGSVQTTFLGDRIIGARITSTQVNLWGLSLKSGTEGALLFNTTWTPPAGNLTISWAASSSEDKVGVLWVKETRSYYGFSLETGEKLWGPTPSQYYLDIFVATSAAIVYGKLYSVGVSGILYCYNVKTGELLWTYEVYDPYQEFLWGNNWWSRVLFITDGKIYLGHIEHSPNQPLPRGAPFICLDAETGDEIFRANGLFRQSSWGGTAIIGDSIIATQDTYDQRVYAIGRGPSATTASIQNDVITQGSSVLIKGTVMDVSPGTSDPALKLRFPNGVPAIADENMSAWMLYVYKQFPRPADAVGVPVTLDAVDPNGTWIHIDTVTSDSSGMFSHAWTPPNEGLYKIIATFPGSKSYYASYAQTALEVGTAPPELATSGGMQESIGSLIPILYGTIVAVAVAIVIGIANLYALRKLRK